MYRIFLSIPVWLAMFLLRLVFILLGWIVVPIAAACRAYEITESRPPGHPKHYDGDKYNFTWKWMFPWGNMEDGVANRNYKQFDSMFMQICYWCCLRNPANNLRYVPYISVKINPDKVKFIGSFYSLKQRDEKHNIYIGLPAARKSVLTYDTPIKNHWFFCWQGLYSNFCYVFKLGKKFKKLQLGFKIYPKDIYGITSHRKESAGFTSRFRDL